MPNDDVRKYVFDVNTLVSAYLSPASLPGQALEQVLLHHSLLMSLEIAGEAAEVLRRHKFDRYLAREVREELLAGTIRASHFVETSTKIAACRDPDDNKLLELAIDGGAAAVITGDADLLVLHPFRGIAVLSPRDFMAALASGA